ncbi:pentapeptide repeat-containing protein [Streptomyces sp. SDT5-1]|uniref:pentapeptide repeat-containing protein n=1 Tax=Streptomyces sp. SDT5-1 TaxID=3406418 RepID=UPI003FD0971A
MSGDKTKKRPWWHWTLAGAGAGAFIVLLVWGPWWIEGHHLRDDKGDLYSSAGIIVTGFRTTLVAIAAGGFTAAGLWYTHKKHELEADSQVTERYVEAVKLLGSDNLHERLGGIYSLERIMKDSYRDHPTIVDVLSAFIRTKLPEDLIKGVAPVVRGFPREGMVIHGVKLLPSEEGEPKRLWRFSEDVKAALDVLNRRRLEDRKKYKTDLAGVQLQDYDLTGVDLRYAHLEGCGLPGHLTDTGLCGAALRKADLRGVSLRLGDLTEVDLREANMEGADLSGARLVGADLHMANLFGVKLCKALLVDANLEGTCFRKADLSGADLQNADLHVADLRGANLEGSLMAGTDLTIVAGMELEQILLACIYESTKLPGEAIRADRRIRARIAQCEMRRRDGLAPPQWTPAEV